MVSYFVDKSDGLNVTEEEEDKEVQSEAKDVKEQAFKYVVKHNNNFICIWAKKLVFRRQLHSAWLDLFEVAYKVTEEKGVFCLEYIDNLAKLAESKLPEHKDFFPQT